MGYRDRAHGLAAIVGHIHVAKAIDGHGFGVGQVGGSGQASVTAVRVGTGSYGLEIPGGPLRSASRLCA
jgi:hypothetical protein